MTGVFVDGQCYHDHGIHTDPSWVIINTIVIRGRDYLVGLQDFSGYESFCGHGGIYPRNSQWIYNDSQLEVGSVWRSRLSPCITRGTTLAIAVHPLPNWDEHG